MVLGDPVRGLLFIKPSFSYNPMGLPTVEVECNLLRKNCNIRDLNIIWGGGCLLLSITTTPNPRICLKVMSVQISG